jgi:hypothetical protein
MFKLTVGENTVCLSPKEEDVVFGLLDQNYNIVKNSPTLNAVYHWLKENGHSTKKPLTKVEDPWNNEDVTYKQESNELRKLLSSLLQEGYYIAS